MRLLIPILFIFNLTNSFAQNNELDFQECKRFTGKIEHISPNVYKFGDKVLTVKTATPLKKIFEKGIFNPDVIFGEETTIKSKAEIDALSETEKVFFDMSRNDSLVISFFKSQNFGPTSQRVKQVSTPQRKWFKFWVFKRGISNPSEYIVELYNDKATKETTMEEFIEDSKMRFRFNTIIL